MDNRKYRVTRRVTVVYTRIIEAQNRADAESIAEDLGTITAADSVDDRGWKARLYVPTEAETVDYYRQYRFVCDNCGDIRGTGNKEIHSVDCFKCTPQAVIIL